MRFSYTAAFAVLLFSACGTKKPIGHFTEKNAPPAPAYADMRYWAAHPGKKDPADQVPTGLQDGQSTASTDVFFLYPTSYLGSNRHERQWNADALDPKINKKTDEGSIRFQASIFNGAGRVYAPYYRQAHYDVFFSKKDTVSNRKALALAYQDVELAFEHYLENWNQGRPFIIAAHSQGAFHAMQLLRRRIEGTPLQRQLVVAYVVGYPVPRTFFKQLPSCERADDTGCFCSWRTYERGYGLKHAFQDEVLCTNPLTWRTTPREYAPTTLNLGGVVRPFEVVRPGITDAEVFRGVILSKKPKFPGSFFFRRKNYHIGDLNLFYMNVRENARIRAGASARG
jgi:hypothetical protein